MSQGILENIQDYYFDRPDADGLLTGETDGFAWNAASTTQYFPKWMTGTSPSAILVRTSNFTSLHDPQKFLTQSGTSPKYVKSSTGIRWAPHNSYPASYIRLNAFWAPDNATVASYDTTAPDGTATADKMTINAGTTGGVHDSSTTVITAGRMFTVSVFAKKSTYRYFTLGACDAGGTNWIGSTFDLDGPSVTGTASAGGGTNLGGTITFVSNGWYRCTMTGVLASTDVSVSTVYLASSGNPSLGNYVADSFPGATGSEAIWFWGYQSNRGYFATDYVKTTSAAKIGIPVSYGEGLLVEPAATNLVKRSQEANTDWTNNGVSVTANSAVAPDGSTTADTITASVTGGGLNEHEIWQDITLAGGTTATHSVYVQNITARYVIINLHAAATDWVAAAYDLQTGTVGSTGTGASGTYISSSITAVGNSWYRLTLTGSCSAANPTVTGIEITNTSTPTFTNYGHGGFAAAGTENVYVWGMQVETGTVATSHIPTLGSTVTRAADSITAYIKQLPYADGAAGSVYGQWYCYDAIVDMHFWGFNDGTDNNRIVLYGSSGGVHAFMETAGGVEADIALSGAVSAGDTVKIGYAWNTNDLAAVKNGGSPGTDSSATLPTGITQFYFGSHSPYYAMRNIVYVPRRMTNGELQSKTT